MAEELALTWHNPQDWGVEGKGWSDTLCPYDRLPAHAEKLVPQAVWDLSRTSIGISAMFETDAPAIHARWQLRSPQLGEANFPVSGFSGLDLYGDDGGTWRWAAAGHQVKDQRPQQCLIDGLAGGLRKFLLYWPLRNPVDKVEIGLPAGARFAPIAPRPAKPMVFYGTSIVHGAYASHAGIVHPAILGRRLNRPVINMGFSGAAKMEAEVASLLGELDAAVFVIDPLPNMDIPDVKARAEAFLRALCGARPRTPVVVVEDRPLTNAWIKPGLRDWHELKWAEYRRIYDTLRAEGLGQLSYVEGRNLFGLDSEASFDSVHPSDLGFMRMADVLEPILRAVI